MRAPALSLVQDQRVLHDAHDTFNRQWTMVAWRPLARDILRRTRYWVYDPTNGTFKTIAGSPFTNSGSVSLATPDGSARMSPALVGLGVAMLTRVAEIVSR